MSESKIRSAYTILRAVLDTAVRDDALAKNPAAAVPRPKVSRKQAAHLTTAQVRTLLEKAEKGRSAVLLAAHEHGSPTRRGAGADAVLRQLRQEAHPGPGNPRSRGRALVVTEPKTEKSKRVIHMSPAAECVLKAVRLRPKQDRLKAGSVWVRTGHIFTVTPR